MKRWHYIDFVVLYGLIQSLWFMPRISNLESLYHFSLLLSASLSIIFFLGESRYSEGNKKYKYIILLLLILAIILDLESDFFSGSTLSRIYYIVVLVMLYIKRPIDYIIMDILSRLFLILAIFFLISLFLKIYFPEVIDDGLQNKIRIAFVHDLIMEFRFGSFIGYVNASGYIGALLVLFGMLNKKNLINIPIVMIGILQLVLSDSRGGYVSLVMCILFFFYYQTNFLKYSPKFKYITCIILTLIITLVFYKFFKAESEVGLFNNRDAIYRIYFNSLDINNFIFGIGDFGVRELISNEILPDAASNAHNLFIDILVRNGFICFAIVLSYFYYIFKSLTMINSQDFLLLFQIYNIVLFSSFSEQLTNFAYLNIFNIILILIFVRSSYVDDA